VVRRGTSDGAMTRSRIIVCGLAGSVTLALCLASAGVASAADWQTQSLPAVQNGLLSGVSCISATACSAVGTIENPPGNQPTLAERRDGATWSVQPTPNPAGTPTSDLFSVSCTSPTACTAVGYYSTNIYHSSGGTLAERWNGVSWTIQATPNPAHATTSYLSGVSCTSPTACTAVGYYSTNIDHSSGGTLAERWNGVSWTIQATPNPAHATTSYLSGVSCTSPTACVAVGFFTESSGQYVTLVERWNGVDWSIQPAPSPAALVGAILSGSLLSGVSCTSSKACTAVGRSYNKSQDEVPLVERWNGVSWSIQPTANVGGLLDGVSCASPRTCTAVGVQSDDDVQTGETAKTLAERWNGANWSLQATPNPGGRQVTLFNAVSCPSTTVCTAVGSSTDFAGTPYTLAERQHGTSWSIQTTTPQPDSEFEGVSCPSISRCTTVGYTGNITPLAEQYQTSTG
jgi:hypothetical protein